MREETVCTYDSAPEEAGPGHGGLRAGSRKQDFPCLVAVSVSLCWGAFPKLTLFNLGRGLPCFRLEQAHADGAVVRHVRVVDTGSLCLGRYSVSRLPVNTGERGRGSDSQT